MAITYQKKETEENISFVYTNNLLYSLVMLAFLIYGVSELPFAEISISVAVAMVFLRTYERFKASKEVRQLAKSASLEISGSHFSFKNPYTMTFKK